MKRIAGITLGLIFVAGLAAATAHYNGWSRVNREFLSGFRWSRPWRTRSSSRASLHDKTEIEYWLTYDDLNGTGTITQSRIHLGDKGTNGGIMLWLCGAATNPVSERDSLAAYRSPPKGRLRSGL